MDGNEAMKTYREMAESAKDSRIAVLQERNARLMAELDDAHAKLFGNNFWLLVIGIAIGVGATVLAMNAFGGGA